MWSVVLLITLSFKYSYASDKKPHIFFLVILYQINNEGREEA